MSTLTFPAAWRVPQPRIARQSPALVGARVVVPDGRTLRAFERATGAAAWSVARNGTILPVVAVDGGCIAAAMEPDGERVAKLDVNGKVVWELDGRWDLWPSGLVSANERFLLSGKRRDSDDSRLWEMSARDGAVLRSIPGTSRPGIIATGSGWAWIDGDPNTSRVLEWDGDRARVVVTAEITALGWARGLLLADGGGALRAFDRNGAVWEVPGGKTQQLAADEHGVACAYEDREGLWIWAYTLDGSPRWKAGPFRSGYPTLAWWGETLIASGITLGERNAVAVFDAADGRMLDVELGGWTGAQGGITIDGDAVYAPSTRALARRERRRWPRIEDAWDASYLVAVAAQLAIDGGPDEQTAERLDGEIAALRTAGARVTPLVRDVRVPEVDLSALRDAVAAYRAAGRAAWDPLADAIAWLFCEADWPLWALDVAVEDLPERRVEMMMFDGEHELPHWKERARIAQYPRLRYLSLRSNALTDAIGIDLSALPRLEYVNLSENQLVRVPAEIARCRGLVHLNLRSNELASLDPEQLPRSLRWLDVAQNRLPDAAIARLQTALPACRIISYAQRT